MPKRTRPSFVPRTNLTGKRSVSPLAFVALLWACVLATSPAAFAADLEEAEKLFRTGRYDECLRVADEEIASTGWSEPWRHWKIKSQVATGKYRGGDGGT